MARFAIMQRLVRNDFRLSLIPSDEATYYDIFCIFAAGLWARLGYPVARRLQKGFVRESKGRW
jgi:hypothetical protein